jgi:hypothetical protein
MPGLTFSITGEASADRVAVLLKTGGRRGVDTRVVMEKIVADMMRVETAIFSSQGRRGGGSWAGLKPDTVRKKGTTEILRTRGAKAGYSKFPEDSLFRSLTEPGAEYQVLDISRNRVLFGTDHPYAEVIAERRPFMKFTNVDAERWKAMIAEHLLAPFVAAEGEA